MFHISLKNWEKSAVSNIVYGSVAVKCKKKLLKLPNSLRKPIKNFYISKCHTLSNLKFEMSEYSNTTYEGFKV